LVQILLEALLENLKNLEELLIKAFLVKFTIFKGMKTLRTRHPFNQRKTLHLKYLEKATSLYTIHSRKARRSIVIIKESR